MDVSGQTFTYSYVDPCKGTTKSIDVPTTGVTISYYGQLNTFQPADFYNGNFESWTNSVYNSFGGLNPCASIIGLPTAVDIAQNTAINFINVLNSLNAITDLANVANVSGTTNLLSGVNSVQNTSKSSNDKKSKKSNNNQNSSSNGSNSSTNNTDGGIAVSSSLPTTETNSNTNAVGTEGGSSTQTTNTNSESGGASVNGSGNSQLGGTNNTSSSGGTADGGQSQETSQEVTQGTNQTPTQESSSNQSRQSTESTDSESSDAGMVSANTNDTKQTSTQEPQPGEEGKTNILGGAVNTVGATSSSPSNKNGNRPSILVSSDFVGFNFKNTDVALGGKVTGGYTAMSWDGRRSYGVLADYTSALKGPNVTGFYAFLSKRRIDVISGTISVGFDKRITAYGTLSAGQMWTLDKRKMVKAVYMVTASYGNVFGTQFVGTAVIAGTVGDFKLGKRFDIKAMMLYVYAPYVSYYNDILLKSPHVVLPILGVNVKITKRFKLNINGSGAWAIKEATLNYSIMMGTRVLI